MKHSTKQLENVKRLTKKILLHYLDFVVKHMLDHEIMSIMDTISKIITLLMNG